MACGWLLHSTTFEKSTPPTGLERWVPLPPLPLGWWRWREAKRLLWRGTKLTAPQPTLTRLFRSLSSLGYCLTCALGVGRGGAVLYYLQCWRTRLPICPTVRCAAKQPDDGRRGGLSHHQSPSTHAPHPFPPVHHCLQLSFLP